MAVDSLRNTFHVNRIAPSELGLLLTAQSYRPTITTAISQVKAFREWRALQSLCSQPIRQGKSPIYSTSGHPCIKTRHIVDVLASKDELDYVTPDSARKLKQFAVGNENILMNRSGAGSIGRVSIYFGDDKPLTDDHIFKIVVAPPHDAAYICCFLASWWGERVIEQGISGTTGQLNLANDHVQRLPISLPLQAVQKYIGDKVRLAERLRERSQYLITSAKLLIEALIECQVNEDELEAAQKALEIGDKKQEHAVIARLNDEPKTSQGQATKWIRRCSALELGSRIDCHFYNPDAVAEIEKVKKCSPKPLSVYVREKRSEPPIHTDQYSESGIAIVSPANFTDFKIDLEGTNKLNSEYKKLFEEFLMREGNLIFSLVGDVGHACVVPTPAPVAITYRRTAHMRLDGINPYLVTAFLNCRSGDLQLKRMTTGVIQAQLRLEDSVEVLIPTWSKKVQNYIGEKVRLGVEMREQVELLTAAAKFLVGALIEGKVTEDELKTAQEALQRGDREPDQFILSRLTRKGFDVKGEPQLFPDLDTLYEAIDQLNADSEEEP